MSNKSIRAHLVLGGTYHQELIKRIRSYPHNMRGLCICRLAAKAVERDGGPQQILRRVLEDSQVVQRRDLNMRVEIHETVWPRLYEFYIHSPRNIRCRIFSRAVWLGFITFEDAKQRVLEDIQQLRDRQVGAEVDPNDDERAENLSATGLPKGFKDNFLD
ncbi:MAG TPA: hypothetical protein VFB54_17325 [Burkholderiales bacterium]|nr:hypothetical protein [Burkholderiales bacterium]